MRKSKLRRNIGTMIGLGVASYFPVKTVADMVIEAVPEKSVATIGESVRVDIFGNSLQHPDDNIISADYDLEVPFSFTVDDAQLPDNINNPSQNNNDFFYDVLMDSNPGGIWNQVDSTLSGNELTANTRTTTDNFPNGGVQNVRNMLGSYWFTPQDTGTYQIGINDVEFVNGDLSKVWRTPDIAGGTGLVQVISQPITIVPPIACITGDELIPGDGDNDGDVDENDFNSFRHYFPESMSEGGPGYISSNGCSDIDGDGDVDMRDYTYFQTFYTGSFGRAESTTSAVNPDGVRNYSLSEGRAEETE